MSRTDANVLYELNPQDMEVIQQMNYSAVIPEVQVCLNPFPFIFIGHVLQATYYMCFHLCCIKLWCSSTHSRYSPPSAAGTARPAAPSAVTMAVYGSKSDTLPCLAEHPTSFISHSHLCSAMTPSAKHYQALRGYLYAHDLLIMIM